MIILKNKTEIKKFYFKMIILTLNIIKNNKK